MWIIFLALLSLSDSLRLPNNNLKLQDLGYTQCSGSTWQPLILNFGRPVLEWTPTTPQSQFNILFVTIQASSPGLEEIQARRHISGKDLECLFPGRADGQGVRLTAGDTKFIMATDLVVGSLMAEGDDLYSPFQGTGSVEVYGLVQTPGLADTPLPLRQEFSFSWVGEKTDP